MREPKYFDSAYPGSMSERKDGSYVEREDSQSLALALLENLYAAQRDAEDWKDQAIAWENQFHAETAALQCKIDALMLEYCPDEMTEAQKENWAKHQRTVTPNALGEGRERGILREASSGEAATSTDGLGGEA